MSTQRTSNQFTHSLLRARDWQDRPELEHLCEWWRNIGGGLYALVGIGGAGKTATIDRFLQIVPGGSPAPLDPTKAPPRRSDLPETVAPFIFSFYDAPNEDSFFGELADWLSRVADDCRPAALPTDVEKISIGHMAQWLQNLASRRERTLLVLDGLEKVQDDGRRTGMYGHIFDGRLRNLLLDIAEGRFGRLAVVVTTRFDLYDPAAEGVPYYWRTFVEQLAVDTCVKLLRARGVQEPDDELLKRLAVEHGRHALTVDLIGGYIGEFCGGHVSQLQPLGEIDLSDVDIRLHPRRKAVIEQERRFARVAERYQESLREQEPATLALLQRLCLFRLGVDAATLTSIFTGDDDKTRNVAGPALAALTAEQLQQTLDRLTAMKLVEKDEGRRMKDENNDSSFRLHPSAFYSIHPAVRDGFLSGIADPDRTAGHEAARAGLTAALGDSPGKNPSDPATLDLLEEIVHHTLQSGHVLEAWDVYQNRIGSFGNLGWRLGAYERGERLCRVFAGGQPPEFLFRSGAFQPPSETTSSTRAAAGSFPYQDLPEAKQAIFLNEWALYLSDLGRLEAAAHCYELNIELRMQQENWANASIGNQNLCNVRLWSGRLSRRSTLRVEPAAPNARLEESSDAVAVAEESLRLAELADDAEERQNSYAYRGHTRALLGEVSAALAGFREALEWQHKREGDDKPLYFGRGMQQARLFTSLGRREESQRQTEANQAICNRRFGVDDVFTPQCRLILASLQLGSGDVSAAERLCHAARDWALARDAKEVLCWSALVQARIELARARPERAKHNSPGQRPGLLAQKETQALKGRHKSQPSDLSRPFRAPNDDDETGSQGDALGWHVADPSGLSMPIIEHLASARTAIDDGLKIARACGFSLFHIDLQLELARLRLLQGQPSEALAAIRTALDETRPKNDETSEPELLAARDPYCGYAWPVPEGLQLRAEALLLQAAQELQAVGWAEPASPTTPAGRENWWDSLRSAHPTVWQLIADAKANLNEALDLWRSLRDPARKNANYRIKRKQYNYRAGETHRILTDLEGGTLTRYPLDPEPESDGHHEEGEVAAANARDQVFISYSHQDKAWLAKLQKHLKPYVRNLTVSAWDDTQISTGAQWNNEIRNALAAAKVAVLLVSPDFLSSDFIAEHELPPLVKAAEKEGLTIVWIPLSASAFTETELGKYQAAHDTSHPLDSLSTAEQNKVLVNICKKIKAAVNA